MGETSEMVERVRERLLELYTPDEAAAWLSLPHPMLNGATAESVIAIGEGDRVLRVIESMESGAYL